MVPATRKRGWTLVLVPPQPTSRTRAVRFRPALVTLAGIVGSLALIAAGSWTAMQAVGTYDSRTELEDARAAIAQLTDSLRRIHAAADAAMERGTDAGEESATAAGAAPAGATTKRDSATMATKPHASVDLRRNNNTRVAATRSTRSRERYGAASPDDGVVLPVIGRITSRFARRRFHPLLRIFRPHYGVDVAAAAGTPIVAPAAGRVRAVGRHLGSGLVVELDHGDGVVTRYLHCRSAIVRPGQAILAGEEIATVGSSGLATGPHLHFEVLVNEEPVDPLRYHFSKPQVMRAEAAPAISAPIPHAPTATGGPAAPAVPTSTVVGAVNGQTGGR